MERHSTEGGADVEDVHHGDVRRRDDDDDDDGDGDAFVAEDLVTIEGSALLDGGRVVDID